MSRMSSQTKAIRLTLVGMFCFVFLRIVGETESPPLLSPAPLVASLSHKSTDLPRHVHQSVFPASAAGQWVYQPDQVHSPSLKYLKCLDREKHGNCHNRPGVTSKQPRMRAVSNGLVRNSPGMFEGMDPYVWVSNFTEYKVLLEYDAIHKVVKGRKFFLIGDSLTRQWRQSLLCEFQYLLNMTEKEAKESVLYLKLEKSFPDPAELKQFLENATAQDYLIFNLGHHIDRGHVGQKWLERYGQEITEALSANFGNIPKSQIFFRTTCVRHFLTGYGDFNTPTYKVGRDAPNSQAIWSMYGGNFPETQPLQNLLALDILSNSSIQILDVSPMMLARGDASYDGTHFCMPGPIDYWSRMLYYRMHMSEQGGT